MRRVVPLVVAAAIVLSGCEPDDATPAPSPSRSPTATGAASPTPGVIGPDPLVTWSPMPEPVGERADGWLRETLLVTAPGDVRLHVRPVSTSMTLEYLDGTRSLAIWIEIENAGEVDWSGVFGVDASLRDEFGNTFLPVTSPQARDLHPDPGRYGYANRNLMQPLVLPTGERTQGVLVFRPTLGNRPATLGVTLDGERTTSWIVNIGQL